VPAIAFARQLIEAGEIGEIYHFHGFYYQDWIADPKFPMVWRLDKTLTGSGALGDIGAHIIDMSRFLVGEITDLSANMKTFVKERPESAGSKKMAPVTVDDAASWIANFDNGAMGTFDCTRFARGRKNFNGFEVFGSKGSLSYNFEEMNKLQFWSAKDGATTQGFREIMVTESQHPYMAGWWPPGHIIGYQNTFVNAVYDFLNAVGSGKKITPDMNDGLRVQAVLEAVEISASKRRWVSLKDLL
jgi:predicted dehydrogenase